LYRRQVGGHELEVTDEQADQLLAAGAGAQVDQMLTYTAAGTPGEVGDYLESFLQRTRADELITAHHAPTIGGRLRSVTLLAEAMQAVTA
jgi:alkanesulfonate monooxygenase SsuD/methylene tetrahydromethanopterin reductase-like flavin-dependent oxidoreductase (luciferase family)